MEHAGKDPPGDVQIPRRAPLGRQQLGDPLIEEMPAHRDPQQSEEGSPKGVRTVCHQCPPWGEYDLECLDVLPFLQPLVNLRQFLPRLHHRPFAGQTSLLDRAPWRSLMASTRLSTWVSVDHPGDRCGHCGIPLECSGWPAGRGGRLPPPSDY